MLKRILLLICLLALMPLRAHAQSAGLIQYDASGQPLTPYAPMTYFGWQPKGAVLPTEQVCASEISYTAPSNVTQGPLDYTRLIDPNNAAMNLISATVTYPTQLQNFYNNPNGNNGQVLPVLMYAKITGDFPSLIQSSTPPTTDMLIRLAACKWGIDEDTLRAQVWTESTWNAGSASGNQQGSANCTGTPNAIPSPSIFNTKLQLLNGRFIENVSNGNGSAGGCYGSWGIGQDVITGYTTTWPMMKDSTAFQLDFRAGAERGCIEGGQASWFKGNGTCTATAPGHGNCDPTGPNPSTGTDLFQGCVAAHFSGAWWDGTANTGAQGYWNVVNGFIGTKPWPGGR